MLNCAILLAGCGGGSGDSAAPGPSSDELARARSALLTSTVEVPRDRIMLQWYDTFWQTASRYQIEKQNADGTWSIIDGVLGGYAPQQQLQWNGALEGAITLRVTAVLPNYTVPLAISGDLNAATKLTVAPPDPTPTLQIDQPQPLAWAANVKLTNAPNNIQSTNYFLDGQYFSSADGTAPVVLSPTAYLAGAHTLSATLAVDSAHYFTVSMPLQINTGKAATQLLLVQSPEALDAYVVATSDAAVVSATLNEDFRLINTLSAPNACAPPPCAPGQAFNAFLFPIHTGNLPSSHYLTEQVTDAAGNLAASDANFTVPSPSTATLTEPVDGASVSGVLHLTGSYSSGTPGALELLVTLSGIQLYDTTVANPGTEVPLDAAVKLTGISPGPHTLGVYVRVGNAAYTQAASLIVNVEE